MAETQLSSYEEIPYESRPIYPTHPDCLATLASLMGMNPVPVDRCRVLELGCATGGNLIPMALTLPDSQFIGIDLSPKQIAAGQESAEALGLKNIELRALSILDVDDSFGQFDYIACHGVYSWVPAMVQEKILAICGRQLAPQGVAYISYNTYPGWHLRAIVREMMGYHVQRFSEPQLRVQQARAFLDFLIQAVPQAESTYHRLLKEEADVLRPAADTYLFHEHLEDANFPVYFSQFMERAAKHGLQYVGESWFHTRLDNLPTQVKATLQDLSENIIQLEQYLDFLHNRTFRRTVLCRDGFSLSRTPLPEVMTRYHVTGLARPVAAQPSVDSTEAEQFKLENGTTATTNNPLIKAALMVLYEAWPRPLPFNALWYTVRNRLPSLGQEGPRAQEFGPPLLAEAVLRCYLSNLVALHIHPPRFALEVGAHPLASPLARWQADKSTSLTNLRHRMVELGELDRLVVQQLDGSRDREAIVSTLTELAAAKTFTLRKDGAPVEDLAEVRSILSEGLESCLCRLARNALLMA